MARLTALFVALALAAPTAAFAVGREQTRSTQAPASTPANASIAALLTTYPNGGDGMSSTITNLLQNAQSVAQARADALAIARLARNGNVEQKTAIARGLLQAIANLQKAHPECLRSAQASSQRLSDICQIIDAEQSARSSFDPETAAIAQALDGQIFAAAGGGTGGSGGGAGGGGGGSGGGGGGVVPIVVSPTH